jgi:hypothetical protein
MVFTDHLKTIGKGLAGIARKVEEKATDGTLDRFAEGLANKVGEVFTVAADGIDRLYNCIESSAFTDGKYDPEKAKVLLTNTAETTRVYGVKAAKTLLELARTGADKLQTKASDYIPSKEDMKRYEGIGSAYRGVLLKPNYEACLNYFDKARRRMPAGVKERNAILADIKANAVVDAQELLDIYLSQEIKPEAKIKALKTYLKN